MSTEDPPTSTSVDKYGIKANKAYRKSDRETQDIIGLKPTGIDDAIRDGSLPPPAPLTGNGKAAAWWGFQLIEYIERRMKLAPAREAKRVVPKPRASSRDEASAKPKPTAKPKKRKLRRS